MLFYISVHVFEVLVIVLTTANKDTDNKIDIISHLALKMKQNSFHRVCVCHAYLPVCSPAWGKFL